MIDALDLSGLWKLALRGKEEAGMPAAFTDTMVLPDSISHAKKCPKSEERYSGYMTDTYAYTGHAWFNRKITLSRDYDRVELFLERTRNVTVYLDGKRMGARCSLVAPHVYPLGKVSAGEHDLTICVKNFDYPTPGGHLTSPDTQTNWLGIVGKLELRMYGETRAEGIMVYPNLEGNQIRVTADVTGASEGTAAVSVDGGEAVAVPFAEGKLTFTYAMPADAGLWDEYHHNLHTLTIDIGGDVSTVPFGMRKIAADGLKLKVNGKQVFLRGKHDGLVFPKTGYAPMDKESWLEVFRIAKEYGINHYRFHTCCPPEAAFAAADEMGIYLEPELPFWGTIAAPGEEGYKEAEQNFLISEGFAMLRAYGNHPSFVMMSMGNELWGSHDRLNEILAGFRAFDDRRLYTSGSNNFQFVSAFLKEEDFWVGVRMDKHRLIRGSYAMCDAPQGFLQTDRPNADHDYDSAIIPENVLDAPMEEGGKIIEIQYGTGVKKVQAGASAGTLVPNLPVISHEVGQYGMYPDFEEGKKYPGSIQPLYLDIFRERLEEKGLFADWRKFFDASSKLAVECYKSEIETMLRSQLLSGFQLLDLQDFPGQGVALVGVLNSLMENKGAVTAQRFRGFAGDAVALIKTPKFVYPAGEAIPVEVLLSYSRPEALHSGVIRCLVDGVTAAEFPVTTTGQRLTAAGSFQIDTGAVREAGEAELLLILEEGGVELSRNDYTFFLYPETQVSITEEEISVPGGKKLRIFRDLEEAKLAGTGAICIPQRGEADVEGTYCTDFWNYPMFSAISRSMGRRDPIGTMGLSIDASHPVMKAFASRSYSSPQWYNLIMHGFGACLDGKENVKIIAEDIDNIERCKRLGVLYEQDGIPVCTSRLWEIAEEPEIKALAGALADYYGI